MPFSWDFWGNPCTRGLNFCEIVFSLCYWWFCSSRVAYGVWCRILFWSKITENTLCRILALWDQTPPPTKGRALRDDTKNGHGADYWKEPELQCCKWTSHFITPYPTCAIIFARHQTRQTGNLRYQLGEAHKCYYPVEEQWLKREKILYAWCTHRSDGSVTSDPGSWPESISRKWHRNHFQNQNE